MVNQPWPWDFFDFAKLWTPYKLLTYSRRKKTYGTSSLSRLDICKIIAIYPQAFKMSKEHLKNHIPRIYIKLHRPKTIKS